MIRQYRSLGLLETPMSLPMLSSRELPLVVFMTSGGERLSHLSQNYRHLLPLRRWLLDVGGLPKLDAGFDSVASKPEPPSDGRSTPPRMRNLQTPIGLMISRGRCDPSLCGGRLSGAACLRGQVNVADWRWGLLSVLSLTFPRRLLSIVWHLSSVQVTVDELLDVESCRLRIVVGLVRLPMVGGHRSILRTVLLLLLKDHPAGGFARAWQPA